MWIVAPSVVRAGSPFDVTVVAFDRQGHHDPSFRGRVRLSASARDVGLPEGYTFDAGDCGVHTFRKGGVIAREGVFQLRVADRAAALTGITLGVGVGPR